MIYELIFALLAPLSLMLITWFFYLKTNNPGVVDVAWALAILLSGLTYLIQEFFSIKVLIVTSLLIFWAIRLSGYLWWTRIKKNKVEKRYHELSINWNIKKELGFLLNFMFQAFLAFCIASPMLLIDKNSAFTLLDWVGAIIVVIAILGEWIADIQLSTFVKENPGKVCNQGLWQYSRHPNYFFEIMVWFGFSLFIISESWGFFGLLSPILIGYVIVYVTLPITEATSIKSKGDAYKNYQQTTSKIFPWIKI